MPLTKQDHSTWLLLSRASAWINQQLARDMLKEDNARITEYDVLETLRFGPERGLRMQDLIDRVVISNSGMTRLVDRLYESEYVDRQVYPENRREVYVLITDKGKELVDSLIDAHQARIDHYFMQHLSNEDKEDLKRIFESIRQSNEIPGI